MRAFSTHLAVAGFLLVASTLSSYARASSFPRMEGPRREECVEALAYAKQVFASDVEDSQWRPPEIFRLGKAGPMWALTVGHPALFLGAWTVYVPGMDTLAIACTIHFRPDAKRAVDLLPKPVRVLEAMLDQTMGSGTDKGTLQPTARLRRQVNHTWAKLALRPWARTMPYNSRATVDRGLEAWASGDATNRKLLRAIQGQYPRAEQALANYYRKRFGKSAQAAQAQASALLDAVFRSHYVYSRPQGE